MCVGTLRFPSKGKKNCLERQTRWPWKALSFLLRQLGSGLRRPDLEARRVTAPHQQRCVQRARRVRVPPPRPPQPQAHAHWCCWAGALMTSFLSPGESGAPHPKLTDRCAACSRHSPSLEPASERTEHLRPAAGARTRVGRASPPISPHVTLPAGLVVWVGA